ncbi:MAG: thioredoxin [Candidatus Harrisonbacteria bacterium]|nr:thioredoxin [Candidatus Harrisonbacteria bacterium]
MNEYVEEVTDANFEEVVLRSDKPVVVDFWAPWCAPCQALAPMFEEYAKKFAGKVKFVKLNIDQNAMTPLEYNVRSIPTLILFKNGRQVDVARGIPSTEEFLKKFLTQ